MTSVPFELGPYRCVEQIGADELADVFRAELSGEAGFVKQYALKRFNERATALPEFVASLTRDAQRNTNLGHGNIVRVVGIDKFDDSHVMVAELVDGVSLRSVLEKLLAQKDRVPWPLAVHLAMELGKALDHAHHGTPPTAHGALSPNHVMLTTEGGVRILNFGLAWSLARSKNIIGKQAAQEYAYLAPEQLQSSQPSARSDLFSLGAILYEMVTGHALFVLTAGNRRRLIPSPMKSLHGEIEALKPILTRLLVKDPTKRFDGADDTVEALQKLQHEKGQAVSSRPMVVWLEDVLHVEEEAGAGAGAEITPDEFDDDLETKVATFEQRVTEPEDLQPLARASTAVPDLPEEDDGFKEDDVTREIMGINIRKSRPSALPLPPLPNSPLGKSLAPADLPGRPSAQPDNNAEDEAPRFHVEVEENEDLSDVDEPEEPTIEKPMVRPVAKPKAESVPAPVPASESESESKPEPKHETGSRSDLGRVTATTTESIRVTQPGRAGTSRGVVFALVVLTMLCVTSVGVAVFLYLELDRMRNPNRTSDPVTATQTTSMTPRSAMVPPPAMAPRRATLRPDPMATDPMATDPMATDPMATDPMATPRPTPPDKPLAVQAVPRKGRLKAYELELLTAPPGVAVIYNNRLLGKTPLRLRAKSGRRYLLVLNKERHKVKAIKPKFSRFVGLQHRVTLKASTYLAHTGTAGQTRLEIRCRTSNIYRVFLNGRDTGRNCPTTLKVSRGPNAPGIYLPDKDRVTFRKIKSIPQKLVKVKFDY